MLYAKGINMRLLVNQTRKSCALFGVLALLSACSGSDKAAKTAADETDSARPAPLERPLSTHAPQGVEADFIGRDGTKIGTATLLPGATGGVVIDLLLAGLTPGWHGTHFHETGDCADFDAGFKHAHGHFNPPGKKHGFYNPEGYEPANLPNIFAHANGQSAAQFFNAGVVLNGEPSRALFDDDGFAIVVHENPDDHFSQPIGGAGGRVACAAFNAKN